MKRCARRPWLADADRLEGVGIVETPDAIRLVERGESQCRRHIVAALTNRGGSEHIEHVTVKRLWGSYTVWGDSRSKLKRVVAWQRASRTLAGTSGSRRAQRGGSRHSHGETRR